MASAPKPTIVIVPGAWHSGPIHYKPLVERLTNAGYEVNALDLPSIDDNVRKSSWKEDVPYIASQIEKAADQGKDVVVVVHSRGGVCGADACEGLSKADRSAQGKPGGVVHLLYMWAFAALEGVSSFLATEGPDHWLQIKNRETWPENTAEIFYNDCSKEDIEKANKRLKRMPAGAFVDPAKYAAFKHIPSTYLLCEKDNAIPIQAQEMLANQPGANFKIERCVASHSPFLSMPDFTAEVVRRAAGEKI